VAAICNACSNYFLISKYQQNGAIIGTIIAESVGLILQLWFTRKYIKETHLFSINTCKYFLAGYVMYILLNILNLPISNVLLHCFGSVLLGAVIYCLCLLLMQENVVLSAKEVIKTKIARYKKS
jgi:peptidoglycan biosynthesis protein MviN/MurJ (putative lipid II flippase)